MRTHSSALQALINSATSRLDESTKIKTALGSPRRLKIYRDANPGAIDPVASGVKTLDIGLAGEMTITGSQIVNFGLATGTLVNLGTDLSSGAAILSIEGNGHWVRGTLGLKGSGADWELNANPTATSGIGFASSASLPASRYLWSGIGPTAPDIDPDFPAFISHENWVDPAAPFITKTIPMDVRVDNLSYEDAEIASNIGDVRITQSSDFIVSGSGGDAFAFGAIVMSLNGSLNDQVPDKPVHQVLPQVKPYGRWASYPAEDTFNNATDITIPAPYKIVVHRADMSVLYKIEMGPDGVTGISGLPLNSPELAQGFGPNKPMRPYTNCAIITPWQSNLIKDSTYMHKYFPGMVYIDPAAAKGSAATNATVVMAGGLTQYNSQLHFFAAPRRPLPADFVYNYGPGHKNDQDTDSPDPYLFDVAIYHVSEGKRSRLTGVEYEPGSHTCHDRHTAKGAPRFDRHPLPAQIVMYLTDTAGVRIKGNIPNKDIKHWFGLACFNHSQHFVQNVQTGETVPDDQIFGGWSQLNGFYAPGNTLMGGLPRSRHFNPRSLTASGSNWPTPDKYGRRHWNGDMRDFLHSYLEPGLWTMFFNSPMHTLAHKHSLLMHWMATTGTTPTSHPSYFMLRSHAWRWLHYTIGWKIGTPHYLGIPRATVERHFQAEMETIYDKIVVPTNITNVNGVYENGIRAFGIPCERTSGDVTVGTCKGTAQGTTLTVTSQEGGIMQVGRELVAKGSGLSIPSGIFITGILTGDGTGVGTYSLSKPLEIASLTAEQYIQCKRKAHWILPVHDFKTFYMAMVFLLMKTTGCWDAMYAKSAKCAATLDFMLACYDKYAVDNVIATKGRFDGEWDRLSTNPDTPAEVVMGTSWADVATNIKPPDSELEDWITKPDGSRLLDRDVSQHLRPQWLWMRKKYITHNAHPDLDEAIGMYEGWYDTIQAEVDAQATPEQKRWKSQGYRLPSFWEPKGPIV